MQFETPVKLTVSVLVAASALVALGLAQESRPADSTPAGSPLRPVESEASQEASRPAPSVPLRPFAGAEQEVPGSSAPSVRDIDLANELRQRLSLTDLDARMEAFQDIAQRVASDAVLRQALQGIADDQADVDLAFSARLAIREADRIGAWGRAGTVFGGQGLNAPQDPMEAMQRQLDQIFGQDPFLNGAFKNDPFFNRPFGGRLGGRPGGVGIDPFAGGDPFERLEKRVEDMRRRMEDARGGAFGTGNGFSVTPPAGVSRSSSTSVTMTPDGIRVEITEDDGSGPKKTTYQAPTKEQLLELHPELKDRLR